MSTIQNRLATPVAQSKKLPITVVIVVKDHSDYSNKDIQAVRKYCQELNIVVESRKFDSYRYNHDRDEIRQLPALHLYVNTKHETTFYLQGRPYQIIHTAVHNFKRTCEERLAQRDGWKKYIRGAWGRVCSLFKRAERPPPEVVMPGGPRSTVLRPTPELPMRRHSIAVSPSREPSKSMPVTWDNRVGIIDMD